MLTSLSCLFEPLKNRLIHSISFSFDSLVCSNVACTIKLINSLTETDKSAKFEDYHFYFFTEVDRQQWMIWERKRWKIIEWLVCDPAESDQKHIFLFKILNQFCNYSNAYLKRKFYLEGLSSTGDYGRENVQGVLIVNN